MEKELDKSFIKCAEIAELFSDILEEQKTKGSEAVFIAITIILQACENRYKTNKEDFAISLVDFINNNIQ